MPLKSMNMQLRFDFQSLMSRFGSQPSRKTIEYIAKTIQLVDPIGQKLQLDTRHAKTTRRSKGSENACLQSRDCKIKTT